MLWNDYVNWWQRGKIRPKIWRKWKVGAGVYEAWRGSEFKRKAYANKYMYKLGLKSIPKRYSGYKLVKIRGNWLRVKN